MEERTHDWQYRRTGQTLGGPGGVGLLDLEYGYDAAGNLVSRIDHLGDRSAGYGYDDLSRLTSAAWTGAGRVYEYDAIGNIVRLGVDEGLPGEGEVLFSYAANPDGGNSPVLAGTETRQGDTQLSSYPVVSDDIGNVTSDGLTSLSYDARNHLEDRGLKGATLDYTYSADGRLVRAVRSDTQSVTDIVLDIAGRRLAKLEGGAWRDYVYLGDQLLAYFDDGVAEPTQVIADHIGMPMMAVDGVGAVIWQATTEPYGELRGEVGLSADPGLRYPGQWQDELDLEADCAGDTCAMPGPLENSYSLFENGYRWYVPRWGRYGQADPIWEQLRFTEFQNTFTYADSNPCNVVDHFGLSPCDGYRLFFGSRCCRDGEQQIDAYPVLAHLICENFMENYRDNVRAECVAKCLVNEEGNTVALPRCAARNAERLRDHVSCYAACRFYDPVFGGFPDYSFEIGGGILWSDYWEELWR